MIWRIVLDPKAISSRLRETFHAYKAEIIEMTTPQLRYDPELALAGRFSPAWEVQALAKDARGKEHKLLVYLNIKGEVIRGLEELEERARPE